MKTYEITSLAAPTRFRKLVPSKALVLDIAERAITMALYSQFLMGLLAFSITSLDVGSVLLVLSEGVPIFFLLIRRFSEKISHSLFDWILAITGSAMPMLIIPNAGADPLVPAFLCDLIILIGLCAQIGAKITLGRSFGIVAANRGIEVTGPYRLVRHPMYLGYTLSHVGFLLLMPSVLNAGLYSCAFLLQVARLLREERLLSEDPAYRAFAARVRYRLVPGVF